MSSIIQTDVLIIGSGIAGLSAARKISEFADVIVVTKKNKAESNTNYAQGGIAAVISQFDSFQNHMQDTLIAGAGLCDEKSVEIMVKEGPDRVYELIDIGTTFTKKDKSFDLAKEGGHSVARILHSKDLTGKEIERALITSVNEKQNIEVRENSIAIDLITEHNIKGKSDTVLKNRNCWGAYIFDSDEGKVIAISAKVTLIATGGVGQVYLHTTNPPIATGDGIAMAFRAGAKLSNMEFIQFHPTSLYTEKKNASHQPAFLISEAVRGYGAKLYTKNNDRFMRKYDARLELAPRDIVARSIDSELKKSGDEYVLLDITFEPEKEIINKFPNIYNHCLELGIEITKERIPVVPAAHYSCGGISVNAHSKTSINCLYACGEVAMTGVHGANRLASNSLLEAVVFSHRASISIKEKLKESSALSIVIPQWDDSGTLTSEEKVLITHNLKEVKQTMWDYVGIVRSDIRLNRAAKRIHTIFEEVEEFYKRTVVFEDIVELRNLIACAHVIIKSAVLRKESRGLHYTLDYPKTLDKPINTEIKNVHL